MMVCMIVLPSDFRSGALEVVDQQLQTNLKLSFAFDLLSIMFLKKMNTPLPNHSDLPSLLGNSLILLVPTIFESEQVTAVEKRPHFNN
jgi:hypothetical protein